MWVLLWVCGLLACEDERFEPEAPPDNCPKISLDGLAGQWIRVQGASGDPKYRFEISIDGDAYTMWNVGGGFGSTRLIGDKRTGDIRFTEVGDHEVMEAFQEGVRGLQRIYVEPIKKRCALRVTEVELRVNKGKKGELPRGAPVEYLEFPSSIPFNFRPCDETLFLGDAAQTHSKAVAEKRKFKGANPSHGLSEAIRVGTWSRADEDGPSSCAYDMDLSFDGRPDEKRTRIPAGDVSNGVRHWYVADWYAPYSGNHFFEIYRYRQCAGADRELIAVSCLEAILE